MARRGTFITTATLEMTDLLVHDDDGAEGDTGAAGATFRAVARSGSKFRQNVALAETAAVLAGYLYLLGHRHDSPEGGWSVPEDDAGGGALRFWLLASYGVAYILRVNVMMRCLLSREVAMEEILFVLPVFVAGLMASFALGGTGCDADISVGAAVGSASLYAGGSYLNSGSELERKRWKKRPENKGKCYTVGLFSLARNINYFGDVVLFSGWACGSGRVWNAWVPLVMLAGFVFHHIPEKEAYLAKRYAAQWPQYKARTKALIPFIY